MSDQETGGGQQHATGRMKRMTTERRGEEGGRPEGWCWCSLISFLFLQRRQTENLWNTPSYSRRG